jgi:hypothetical protein
VAVKNRNKNMWGNGRRKHRKYQVLPGKYSSAWEFEMSSRREVKSKLNNGKGIQVKRHFSTAGKRETSPSDESPLRRFHPKHRNDLINSDDSVSRFLPLDFSSVERCPTNKLHIWYRHLPLFSSIPLGTLPCRRPYLRSPSTIRCSKSEWHLQV